MSMEFSSSREDARAFGSRYKILYGVVLSAAFLLFMRLWYLQIISGSELREFSEDNLLKEVRIPAPRGIVFDRDGEILVENLPGFEATISPQYTTDLDKTADAVSQVLLMPKVEIIEKVKTSRYRNGPFRPVVIKENLSRDEVFSLELLKLDHPGLDIKENILRTYALGTNGAQLFGYVGEISKKQLEIYNKKYFGTYSLQQGDIIGKNGLEETLDFYLRGRDGLSFIKVDARGREAASEDIGFLGSLSRSQKAVPGSSIVLTIDKYIQEAAYKSFNASEKTGALVALRPNGEVLAWLSMPSFDPNVFSRGISSKLWSQLVNDPDKPLRNKVIQDHNSPGSTFKPFVAVAALQEGVITKDTLVHAPGSIRFGNRTYHDHTRYGQGTIKVREALERSSNVFFYKQGINLGVDLIAKYTKALGLGEKTKIDLVNEVPGLIPTSEWKKENIGEEWQPGENLSVAIGQGYVLVTPLQMAVAFSAIATEGKVYKPFLVQKIISRDGKVLEENTPDLVRDLSDPKADTYVSPETFKAVKEGLWAVANGDRGTARWWKVPGVEMAGKTGTAQVMSFSADQIYAKCDERPRKQRHHGWYVGYAPADKPEIVVAALAEHACAGSSGAAPLVRDVIKAYFEKYHPEILAEAEEKRRLAARKPKPRTEASSASATEVVTPAADAGASSPATAIENGE